MLKRMTLPSATLLAVASLLGGLMMPTPGEKKSEAGERPCRRSPLPNSPSVRLHRRAVEAVIWGMPAVNAQLMFDAVKKCGSDFNQIVYWSRPLTWKNQTLTPNPNTIYVFPFYNTKDVGPMVLEIPPADGENSITGSVDDGWQTALQDVGPAGVDKGKGGKYLILPPGYKEKVPDGYIVLPSRTYTGFAILRSNLKSGSEADVAKAVAYGKRIEVLSAVAGGESAGDEVRRRDRRLVRQHDPLRPALLRGARPLRAARAVDRSRPGHDRFAEDDRHREGQAVQARREDETNPQRRDAGSARLAGLPLRAHVQGAVQRGLALGIAGVAGGARRA